MKSKNSFQRGFTLIELMIVIVILGILMGTILPRLTGAQGRARDTSRRADLANIAQALEVYYNDFNKYPNGTGCLCDPTVDSATVCDTAKVAKNTVANDVDNGKSAAELIKVYLKGTKIIKPATTNLDTNGCVGSYYYSSLKKGGVDDSAYVLVSQMETYQMANYDANGTVAAHTGGPIDTAAVTDAKAYENFAAVSKTFTAESQKNNADDAAGSLYFVIP